MSKLIRLRILILLTTLLIASISVPPGHSKKALAAEMPPGQDSQLAKAGPLATVKQHRKAIERQLRSQSTLNANTDGGRLDSLDSRSTARQVRFDAVKFSLRPPDAPTLYSISNPDGSGHYTIDWSEVTAATCYELQEQQSGCDWETIHTDSSSQYYKTDQFPGQWCYRVRASNSHGSSDWSNIECTTIHIPITELFIDGPEMGMVGVGYTFTATVNITATLPITYIWQTKEQSPITQIDGSISDTRVLSWDTNGSNAITVTATNIRNTISSTNAITIYTPVNHPPQALDVTITPTLPTDYDNLTLTYIYSDTDGDPEGNTQLHWYRDGTLQPAFNHQETISSSVTLPGEYWCANVTPHDGTEYGVTVQDCVYIETAANNPPQALDVTISPATPTDYDSLKLTYVYSDTDGDSEGDTQLRWYRNDMLQPAFNDADTVLSTATYLGETWRAIVRPHDGIEYGSTADSNCVIIRTPDNHLPQALNSAIEPATPESGDDLTLTYVYTDADGDLEDVDHTQLRWYRNDILQPAFNDQTIVQATDTLPGERWHATIHPHDGHDYGLLAETTAVWITQGITNTPPEVRDVYISPAQPLDEDHLYLTYTYLDADGDLESDTLIHWYRNMEHRETYDGQTVVPASETEVGDLWYARVTPHDGQDYGNHADAHSVEVRQEAPPNTPPEVLDAYLIPDQPCYDDQIELHYDYYDVDGDPEEATQIRWTADEEPQPARDDMTVIPANATSLGEIWCATVTPHDGKESGKPFGPVCGLVEDTDNNPPQVKQAYIIPSRPISSRSLGLSYDYSDLDGDPQSDTQIHWYMNSERQEAYDGQTVVPANATNVGENWYVIITPHDGQEYGEAFTVPTVTINHPPRAYNARISPAQPNACQALCLDYNYADDDNDPANKPQILWYCDDTQEPDLNDQECVSASNTSANQRWYVTVTPNDGYEDGNTVTATHVIISNENCELPANTYLPLLLSTYMDLPYEENDVTDQAYGPLSFDMYYNAYPEDIEDWYYLVLTRTWSIQVKVTDYSAEGQLLVYACDDDNFYQLGQDGRELPTMEIPNELDPDALKYLSPGVYYIRIYSSNDWNYNFYHLIVSYVSYR